MASVTCDRCHAVCVPTDCTTGYGTDPTTGAKHCFQCCGDMDRAALTRDGKGTLYLIRDESRTLPSVGGLQPPRQAWKLTNWPGTLSIPLHAAPRKSRHNIAGARYDVSFHFEGSDWHGVQYGENTQICRVRRMKGKA